MSTKASSDHKYNCYREENHGCLALNSYPVEMFMSRKLGAPVQVEGSKVSIPQHTQRNTDVKSGTGSRLEVTTANTLSDLPAQNTVQKQETCKSR